MKGVRREGKSPSLEKSPPDNCIVVIKEGTGDSVSAGSASVDSTNQDSKTLKKKKIQKVPKSKTGICSKPATIYMSLTLYLQLFT